jgi:N-acetylneuraminate lyase
MKNRLEGLVAATHTPFHPDGSLASGVIPQQAAHLSSRGIQTVFITGSTGEWASLTAAERLRVFEAWAAAGPEHGMRVIAHVGDNCLENCRRFATAAAGHRFHAISALAPVFFKPASLGALVDWCAAIAECAPDLPFYYYDIPSMTGVSFDPEEFLRAAARRIPNLAGIKFTNPDIDAYRRCLALDGGRFDLPWGIDERQVEALAAGARGAVGSTYNFAAPLYQEMMRRLQLGDTGGADYMQAVSRQLVETLAEPGYFGAAKALMGWLGVPVGPARPPLSNPSSAELVRLRSKLETFEWFGGPLLVDETGAGALAACAR